jgi:hypothetical protein
MPPKKLLPNLSGETRFNVPMAPSARFAVEYAAIVSGMSATKVAERGILAFADGVEHRGRDWRYYWDLAQGSVACAWALMFAEKSLPYDDEQQRLRDFLLAHERFFFERSGSVLHPRRRNVEALWPYVADGILPAHWYKTKEVDAWATGEKMNEILKKTTKKTEPWGPGHEK